MSKTTTELLAPQAQSAGSASLEAVLVNSVSQLNLNQNQCAQLKVNLRTTYDALVIRARASSEKYKSYAACSGFKDMAKLLLAEIDAELTERANEILHDPEFQALEASWRGLHYLVQETPNDPRIEVRVLSATLDQIREDLGEGLESWKRSGLYRMLFSDALDTPSGDPYGVLVGAYEFDFTSNHVGVLEKFGEMGKFIGLPFVSSVSPKMFDMANFTELARFREGDLLNRMDLNQYTEWHSFRGKDHARYVALVMPNILLRRPYDPETNAIREFNFREEAGSKYGNYLWGSAAYALAARMVQSYATNGWHTALCGWAYKDGLVNLPRCLYQDDLGQKVEMTPTGVYIPDTRFGELRQLGFIPLSMRKKETAAVFLDVPTCRFVASNSREPSPEQENLQLASDLRNVLTLSRVSHYLVAICRDFIGSGDSPEQIRQTLNTWIRQYVVENADAKTTIKNGRPLKQASIQVQKSPDQAGCYSAKVELVPHIHFKVLRAKLSIVGRLDGAVELRTKG